MELTQHEEEMYRAWRLGIMDAREGHHPERGLASILNACYSDKALDAAIETREHRLARELAQERAALRALNYGGTDD